MNISRRWFIGGAASFGAFQGCRFIESPFGRSGVARLKFGVVSDIHIIAENTDRGYQGNTRVLRHAFRWFDAQGADGVIIAGDMADAGLVSQLQCVADAWNDVFPGNMSKLDGRPVEKLFVYGNHDWDGWGYGYQIFDRPSRDLNEDKITQIGMKKCWEEVFEEEYSPIYRKVVKGYTFVGGHWDSANGSGWGEAGPQIGDFFAKYGKEIDPSLPFFYYQHPHPKNTCYGPWAWGHDGGVSTKVLSNYPNAIAFSGHSHYSLLDERSIWQGAFTSLGTGSLRYAAEPHDEFMADGGFENTRGGAKGIRTDSEKLMPKVHTPSERNGMLFSVYDDHITITRRDFGNDVDLGPDWVMPLPAAESKPFAFAEHAKKFAAPAFATGAKIAFENRKVMPRGYVKNDFKSDAERKEYEAKWLVPCVVAKIPSAVQTFEQRVWRYEVEVIAKDGKVAVKRRVVAPDFHLPIGKAVKAFDLPIEVAKLPKGAPFTVKVTPYNCFGRAGAPLKAEHAAIV